MRIDSVEFFYAAMPEVTLAADGSQDALLVRVTSGDYVGWGECEASPLVSIAAFVTPRSHGVCQPVADSVLGETLDSPADIARIAALVERNSMDLLQAAHTFSGIEIAMWDLLGHRFEQPVWKLLGYERSTPKVPYASMLFGESPQQTLEHVRAATAAGFRAVKVGWGGFGEATAERDADHLMAAREALGADGILLVDAGQIFVTDVDAAAARIPALAAAGATWLEEPFLPDAYRAHSELAARSEGVGIAGGEGAHTVHMATNLIDYGGVSYVQIDTGRIGGIGAAKAVADYAAAHGVTYVNHTFTTHLALSASLQPYAGLADHRICEYPVEPSTLARDITRTALELDANGEISAPDAPGLGLDVAIDRLGPYLRTVDISVDGTTLYASGNSAGRTATVDA
ncbi:mandelate racemase/muconate lactonizing enzyme family protein [Schumannella luteola]